MYWFVFKLKFKTQDNNNRDNGLNKYLLHLKTVFGEPPNVYV